MSKHNASNPDEPIETNFDTVPPLDGIRYYPNRPIELSDTFDRKSALLYGLLVFVAGIALGVLIGTGTLGENKTAQIPAGPPPDYTVANCDLWSTDTAPVLPPYTVANACLTDDEMISW